jgi:hypothetical protein
MISGKEANRIFCERGHTKLLHKEGCCAYYENKNYHKKQSKQAK